MRPTPPQRGGGGGGGGGGESLVGQVDELRQELATHKELKGKAASFEGVRQLATELRNGEEAATEVREENKTLRLEKEGLKAELAYVQARLKGLVRTGAHTPDKEESRVPQVKSPLMEGQRISG